MGPLIILDKSALQCFSRDEMWMLTKHYLLAAWTWRLPAGDRMTPY